VLVNPEYEDKWNAIEGLANLMARMDQRIRVADLVSSLTTREHAASTCLGHGLMIPHGQLPKGYPMAGVMAVSREGWDFGAPDGQPVRCIVMLATPDGEASRHLAVLAAFARLFTTEEELRSELVNARSPEEVIELLRSDQASAVNYAFQSRGRTTQLGEA
jgi:mannitol/fructose-specific phosphotransferase system IIA component (Ntr-type)